MVVTNQTNRKESGCGAFGFAEHFLKGFIVKLVNKVGACGIVSNILKLILKWKKRINHGQSQRMEIK